MKKYLVFLGVILIALSLAACSKTVSGKGFVVNLPDSPVVATQQISLPTVGDVNVNKYTLAVKDPACEVLIESFKISSAIIDAMSPEVLSKALIPAFYANMGYTVTPGLAAVKGFSVHEIVASDQKTIVRVYINKPDYRIIKITTGASKIDRAFSDKIFASFVPAPIVDK
jgi:hypothetical protein